MRYCIAFLVSLIFVSCSTSQDEIQSQIDIAVDKALKQKESDTQILEEKIENLVPNYYHGIPFFRVVLWASLRRSVTLNPFRGFL